MVNQPQVNNVLVHPKVQQPKILVIDCGRDGVKVVNDKLEQKLIPSRVTEGNPDVSNLAKGDIVIELPDGSVWFVGEKAADENPMSHVNFDTKVSQETLLLCLAAAYEMGYYKDFELVFGIPYEKDVSTKEKLQKELTELLKGTHKVKINGENVPITFKKPIFPTEGAGAFYYVKKEMKLEAPLIGVIDIGARTTHLMFFRRNSEAQYRLVEAKSAALPYGFESNNGLSNRQFAKSLFQETRKLNWEEGVLVLNVGGPASVMEEHLKQFFKNVETPTKPRFANSLGFLEMAKVVLAKKQK